MAKRRRSSTGSASIPPPPTRPHLEQALDTLTETIESLGLNEQDGEYSPLTPLEESDTESDMDGEIHALLFPSLISFCKSVTEHTSTPVQLEPNPGPIFLPFIELC